MGNKKAARRVAPNMSSASSLSAAAATKKSNSSSILRSAFSPSRFQLSLFASVIQSLDSQQLRIHDTATGRLRCEYTTSRAEITALDWGYYGSTHRTSEEHPSKKRRRRTEDTNGESMAEADVVVGVGTSKSQIYLYSPAAAKVLATLSDGGNGIRDFKFRDYGLGAEAWSIGSDGGLAQWNLREQKIIRTVQAHDSSISMLLPLQSSLLVASDSAYLVDLSTNGKTTKLGDYPSQIEHLDVDSRSEGDLPRSYLASTKDHRSISIHSLSNGEIIGSLINETDVTALSISENSTASKALAAVTKSGLVEIFDEPFSFLITNTDLKSKRKQMTKKSAARIQVSRPGKDSFIVPITSVVFHESELVIAFAEGSAGVGFERVQWSEGPKDSLSLSGLYNLERKKTLVGIDSAMTNGVKDMGRMQVDESKTIARSGVEVDADVDADDTAVDNENIIDISSAEEDSESNEGDGEDWEAGASDQKALVNGVHTDMEMIDAGSPGDEGDDQEEGEEGEPSFGELLRANTSGPVDVAAAFPAKDKQIVPFGRDNNKQIRQGLSLTTVLSQALRSSDNTLLENCLHEHDLNVIRATIEKLDSAIAMKLLEKLAEKLHSRPGRAGSLLVWIQWTLVAHGGYLASQPAIVKQLSSLHAVVRQRANSLQHLLSLKGKLDMLEAQINFRRSMLNRHGKAEAIEEGEEDVIYVEGQEDSDSAEDSELAEDDISREDKDDEAALSVDIDDDSELESVGGLIDDEASETDEDSEDDEEAEDVDYDDVDSMDEDSDEDEPALARSKGKLTNGIAAKRR